MRGAKPWVDKERARALRSAGMRLRDIALTLGCSKERIRQLVGPVPRCSRCNRRILRLDLTLCRRCREKEPKKRHRFPCAWCGEPGGYKRRCCKKHYGKWHYATYRET